MLLFTNHIAHIFPHLPNRSHVPRILARLHVYPHCRPGRMFPELGAKGACWPRMQAWLQVFPRFTNSPHIFKDLPPKYHIFPRFAEYTCSLGVFPWISAGLRVFPRFPLRLHVFPCFPLRQARVASLATKRIHFAALPTKTCSQIFFLKLWCQVQLELFSLLLLITCNIKRFLTLFLILV